MKTTKYTVIEKGQVIGTLELTLEQVTRFTAAAVYTLIPEGGR